MTNIFFELGQEKGNARANREKVIFVEGADDAHFLDILLDQLGASPENTGVVTVNGKGNFPSQLKLFAKSPAFTTGKIKRVCIIRDADDSVDGAVSATRSAFFNAFGISPNHGEFTSKDNVDFGFFIMPNSLENGDLEKLCLSTVIGNELESRAADFLNSLEAEPVDQYYKRKAQVYLAGHVGELCRGAGLGFKRGHFDDTSPNLDELKEFLRDLLA